MKKISLTFCLALLSSLFCPAQVSPLQFNKNGEFKIVQFTDIHFKYGNPASDIALKRIGAVSYTHLMLRTRLLSVLKVS